MNNVIVTAHPDDETLWAGGLLIREGGTVICCSIPKSDVIRAWKFYDACEALGVVGKILPLQEGGPTEPLRNLEALDLERYSRIITHNKDGEYGHPHHKQLNEYIFRNYGHKDIWTFQPKDDGAIKYYLTDDEQKKKIDALKCYNHIWPYRGQTIPKWEALIHRYGEEEGIDFSRESYEPY